MAETTHQCYRDDYRFSVQKLWNAVRDNEVLEIPIEQLVHMLDVWIWAEGTPNQVMRGEVPDEENHLERVEKADLSMPIIISKLCLDNGEDVYDDILKHGGKYDVLDGIHRLVKYTKLGRSHVKVVVATKSQIMASQI